MCTGHLERGKIRKGDQCRFLGYGSAAEGQIRDIESYKKSLTEAIAGDQVGCLIKVTAKDSHIDRGMVMVPLNSNYTSTNRFQARIYMQSEA